MTTTDIQPAPATVTSLPAAARRPPDGRAGRRVIGRIEPRSVLRFSLLFYACVFAVVLVAGAVLWVAASATGVVGNIEEFIGDLFALEDFQFEPLVILRVVAVAGVVLVLVGTALNVLGALLYNQISEVVGGIELTGVEEPTHEPSSRGVL